MDHRMTEEFYTHPDGYTLDILYHVLLYSVCAFGIIGNVGTLVVLSRPQMKSPFNVCLISLALFDLTFLTTEIITDALPETKRNIALLIIMKYASWTGSVWTTVGVSCERFIAVYLPLKAKTICTRKRLLFFNFFILLFSVCYNLPRFIWLGSVSWVEYQMAYVEELGNTSQTAGFSLTDTVLETRSFNQICYDMDIALMCCLPILMLAVLNISIYVAVRKAESIRQKMAQHNKNEVSMSMTVIWIVLVFCLAYVPLLITAFFKYGGNTSTHIVMIARFGVILRSANSAANFIIYCALQKKFRRTLLQSILCCQDTRFREKSDSSGFYHSSEQASMCTAVSVVSISALTYAEQQV